MFTPHSGGNHTSLWSRLARAWKAWKDVPAAAPSDEFASRLITVQEEERKRLSRDLHDGVGQVITALKMELSRVRGADDGSDAVRLQRARDHADEAMATIRGVSRLLRPTLLDDLGLEAALQWHVDDFSRRTGIHGELSFLLADDGPLPDAVSTCIYRTVQEALNNCEKHSKASAVTVRLAETAQALSISVADNGIGISTYALGKDHFGIRGMRERAHLLGGKLQVESDVGNGTTVNLTLPR
jgi:signal transduction histidine kinase